MTHFEYLESIGQTNIFDFLDITPMSKRNKGFFEGDKVKIRYYVDEIEFIRNCHPQLMEVGEIIGKKLDFYSVLIGEEVVKVPGEKLILI